MQRKLVRLVATTLLICDLVGVSFAQTAVKGVGKVSGTVIEKKFKIPIEFATISVFNRADSTLLTGGITSPSGVFLIADIPKGSYYIKVDFIGYDPSFYNNIEINDEQQEVNLGELTLTSFSKNMDQFEFVDEKELMETKIDKKIYNVSKDISVQGGTGLDVLKNMPSVEVDQEDKISLRGDKGVQILIDGRPTTISASDLLKQIPASSIERVEVITNPSAKYDPEGMSGILNVIMKKEKASGFNGSVNLGYRYNGNNGYNSSLNFTYRKNKINLSSNVGIYTGNWEGNGDQKRNFFGDTTYTQQNSSHSFGDHKSLYYSLGFDYYINKKNTFYVNANSWDWSGKYNSNRGYQYFDAENILQSFSDRISKNDNKGVGYSLTTGWQTQFNSSEHTLDVEVTMNNNNNKNNGINEHTYSLINQNNQYQNTNQDGFGNKIDVKMDYVLPITDSLKLEAGVRGVLQNNNSEFYSESTNLWAEFLPDTNLNNTFDYNQNVFAAYAIIAKQFKKIGIKMGSRVEQTLVNTELINTKEINGQNYLSWFPSVHLSYKITDKNEVLLSYSRRINRPEDWDVNPFTSYSDPYNLRTGNPQLKPEYIDVYEMTYLKFWDKINFNSSVYFRQVNDKHQSITTLTENSIYVSSPQNLSKSQITGGEMTLGYNPKKWWKMNGTLNVWSSNLNDASVDFNQNTYGWSSNFSTNFTMPKKWSANARIRYSGKQRSIQGVNLENYNVGVSVSKQFLKEKARLTLRFDDIFQTQRWAFESNNLGNSNYTSYNRWSSTSVNLNFSYTFGKMNYNSQKRATKDKSAGDNLKIDSGSSGGGEGK